MKVINSAEKITSFGGFNFVFEAYKKSGLGRLIDCELGDRVKQWGFNYSDIILNHLAVYFNGGDTTEDINEHLRTPMQSIRGMKVCSADTILRGLKELSISSQIIEHPESKIQHQFNINRKLNRLLIQSLLLTGQLNTAQKFILDYDNKIIPTEKLDAARTYQKTSGYQPGVASVNNLVVYVEGRNGNSQAKFKQDETLKRVFANLAQQEIKISKFRADSASCQNEVIEVVEQNSDFFYIRAISSLKMQQRIGCIAAKNWKKVRIGTQKMEVSELRSYRLLGGQRSYRLVVSRIPREDKQINLFTGEAYVYRSILTNDRKTSAKSIIAFYNQRGESERLFDVMNNDFGWTHLPCSYLSENTAYMILTSLYSNFYRYIISSFSEKLHWLQPTFRLKKFIFRFIAVAAKWIKTGRRYVLKLYTDKDYCPLFAPT